MPNTSVHPRVCGEHFVDRIARGDGCGSSPRVWGTRGAICCLFSIWRFIPACVGNSPPPFAYSCSLPVHPRVCGELSRVIYHIERPIGSSPRVWGTLLCSFRLGLHRFIPACVGNSIAARGRWLGLSVHPRVCGELSQNNAGQTWLRGSSPRVWGTPVFPDGKSRIRRFIPACVGNSVMKRRRGCLVSVHPRVCGELTEAQSQ